MKEATGEANLTIITIVLIGTIMPIFSLIIPRLLNSIQDRSCCLHNNGILDGNNCVIHLTQSDTCTSTTCRTTNLSGYRNQCNH